MGFNVLENCGGKATESLPADAVRVISQGVKSGATRGRTGYISITIGADVARNLGLTGTETGVSLALGDGNDAGRIAVIADPAGDFVAKALKNGTWRIAIGARSADGLFALRFEGFTRQRVEVIRPENGQPRMATFLATAEMLDAEGDGRA